MAADPLATGRTMIEVLSALPILTQAPAPDLLTQTGAILTIAEATKATRATPKVPIEMVAARGRATIHDIMNRVLNFVTMIKAVVINGLAPGVLSSSHGTLTRIIVLRAMVARVILKGIIDLLVTLVVLTRPLTASIGLKNNILACGVVPGHSEAIPLRTKSISTSGNQKTRSLKGITNVLMVRGSKNAQRFNLTRGRGLKLPNGMSRVWLTGVFSRDLVRPNVKMLSSGRV